MDEQFRQQFMVHLNNVKSNENRFSDMTEEATKNALIMPFLVLLGYNVFDLNEVVPEYTCDVGTKKGEKIDYAIMRDGEVSILVEAKRAGIKLQKQQQSQLYRYFGVSRCRIAVLTNGITYQFFSDINSPNVMDDEPFFAFNILEDDPDIFLSPLQRFRRQDYNEKEIINKAIFQKYEKVVQKMLKQDMISPSNEIIRYFLSSPEINTGSKITSKMVEKYREATAIAIRKTMGVTIEGVCHETTPVPIVPVIIANTDDSTEDDQTEQEEMQSEIDAPTAEMEQQSEPTLQSLISSVHEVVTQSIPGGRVQDEETPVFCRVHIYASDNRKLGAVKIMNDTLEMQYREITGDRGTYDLKSADDLREFISV